MREVTFNPVLADRLATVDLGPAFQGTGGKSLENCMRFYHSTLRAEEDPNIVVFDTETRGVDFSKDRIWEIGFYFPTTNIGMSFCPDLGEDVWASCAWEIDRRHSALAAQGIDVPRDAVRDAFVSECAGNASDPEEIFDVVSDVFYTWDWLVGHNCVRFDLPFLRTEIAKYGFKLNEPGNVVDTGMLVKAAKLGLVPLQSEPAPISFYRRVANIRAKGVYFSIEKLSAEFGLVEALDFDASKAHGAVYDSWVSCQLLRLLAGKAGLNKTNQN